MARTGGKALWRSEIQPRWVVVRLLPAGRYGGSSRPGPRSRRGGGSTSRAPRHRPLAGRSWWSRCAWATIRTARSRSSGAVPRTCHDSIIHRRGSLRSHWGDSHHRSLALAHAAALSWDTNLYFFMATDTSTARFDSLAEPVQAGKHAPHSIAERLQQLDSGTFWLRMQLEKPTRSAAPATAPCSASHPIPWRLCWSASAIASAAKPHSPAAAASSSRWRAHRHHSATARGPRNCAVADCRTGWRPRAEEHGYGAISWNDTRATG